MKMFYTKCSGIYYAQYYGCVGGGGGLGGMAAWDKLKHEDLGEKRKKGENCTNVKNG